MLSGSNLTGGETFYQEWAGSVPSSGSNYLYVSNQDIDYAVAKGMTVFRLLFSWEAIQQTPLATLAATPSASAYFTNLKSRVDYITKTKGLTCLIDIHGGNATITGAAYYGVKVGGTYKGVAVDSAFADLWSRVATVFKDNPKVWFGLMNEPNGIPALTWFACAQKALNAIRATGSTNKIVAPGVGYTSAGGWSSNGNAAAWNLSDSASNLAVQVHTYFDASEGGGGTDIVSANVVAQRLAGVVTWARSKGLQVFIGELGLSAANAGATAAWVATMSFINANADVIIGWCFWAYGPPAWWAGYQFTLCPNASYTTDSAQMKLIQSSFSAPVVVTPPPVVTPDPQIAVLQAQVAALTTANAMLQYNLNSETTYANGLLAKIAAAEAALA